MEEESLKELGIHWSGTPKNWKDIPLQYLPICSHRGEVKDGSGVLLFTLYPKETLGKGTFGIVESFYKKYANSEKVEVVAMKRPTHPKSELLYEGLMQWKLHKELKIYGIEFFVPEVYDILLDSRTEDVWFTMEALEPILLSQWCVGKSSIEIPRLFGLVLLQIALLLEVLEEGIHFDHRDLKVNNLLIVEQPVSIQIQWKGEDRTIHFPFRIVLVDFGFSCIGGVIDIQENKGLPPIDACPKLGRDMFQVLVSLWSIKCLRGMLESTWGNWVRKRLMHNQYILLTETSTTLDWMYLITGKPEFNAPLCTPNAILKDCIHRLELLL
jgi:serine/threonine protein kinase